MNKGTLLGENEVEKLNSVNVNCAVQAENEFWCILIQLISLIDKHEKAKSNFIAHLAHPLFLCLFFFC